MAAGVTGYLLKTLPSHELVAALRDACTGSGRPPADLLAVGARRTSPTGAPEPDEELTTRESEVVRLVARGMSNKAIAHELGISPRTVEGHLNHVFDKLGIQSRTELVHYALANSLFAREPVTDRSTDGDRVGPATGAGPLTARTTRRQSRATGSVADGRTGGRRRIDVRADPVDRLPLLAPPAGRPGPRPDPPGRDRGLPPRPDVDRRRVLDARSSSSCRWSWPPSTTA